MDCRADPHRGFRRHHHPDLLADGLPSQHNMRSERLGHPHGERKALGPDSLLQVLGTHTQHDLAFGSRR